MTPSPNTPSGVAPVRIVIDSDQTMDATGGDGVGVFVEYQSGGKWHVFWTCDTTLSAQACDFAIQASVADGEFKDLDASKVALGTALSASHQQLNVTTHTSVQIHEIWFSTQKPGVPVTIAASVSGLQDGSLFFFVQKGQVNGGYTGALTNPVEFEGSTP